MQPNPRCLMKQIIALLFAVLTFGCANTTNTPKEKTQLNISKEEYKDQLYGFWLGQCIANWTGLVTEMDKIGNIGDIKTGEFYTRKDWGKADQPSIWSAGVPSDLSATIDFVFRDTLSIWGADDDTDIEYMYQYLMFKNQTSKLTPEQIRKGWLKHIKPTEENYLWVSNQRAFDLMNEGIRPPATGNPDKNEHYAMIDAQLTTEIFGLFAPARPDIAIKIAELPIQTVARNEAEDIAKFYVYLHALAALEKDKSMKERIHWMAEEAKQILTENTYPIKMYEYVKKKYDEGIPWEQTRDSIYQRYQVEQKDGYTISSKNLYCNGCFAAGINFAASLISLFYGEGDLKQTIKIATLAGWDSDNPSATWGGLIGFMIGKKGVEQAFNRKFSDRFNIHRTRQNFPNNGLDNFDHMAEVGLSVVDVVVKKEMHAKLNDQENIWVIPLE